jgi:hypothetical protein
VAIINVDRVSSIEFVNRVGSSQTITVSLVQTGNATRSLNIDQLSKIDIDYGFNQSFSSTIQADNTSTLDLTKKLDIDKQTEIQFITKTSAGGNIVYSFNNLLGNGIRTFNSEYLNKIKNDVQINHDYLLKIFSPQNIGSVWANTNQSNININADYSSINEIDQEFNLTNSQNTRSTNTIQTSYAANLIPEYNIGISLMETVNSNITHNIDYSGILNSSRILQTSYSNITESSEVLYTDFLHKLTNDQVSNISWFTVINGNQQIDTSWFGGLYVDSEVDYNSFGTINSDASLTTSFKGTLNVDKNAIYSNLNQMVVDQATNISNTQTLVSDKTLITSYLQKVISDKIFEINWSTGLIIASVQDFPVEWRSTLAANNTAVYEYEQFYALDPSVDLKNIFNLQSRNKQFDIHSRKTEFKLNNRKYIWIITK